MEQANIKTNSESYKKGISARNGFILSITGCSISLFSIVVGFIMFLLTNFSGDKNIFTFFWVVSIIGFLFSIIGMIVSIVGKGKKWLVVSGSLIGLVGSLIGIAAVYFNNSVTHITP